MKKPAEAGLIWSDSKSGLLALAHGCQTDEAQTQQGEGARFRDRLALADVQADIQTSKTDIFEGLSG